MDAEGEGFRVRAGSPPRGKWVGVGLDSTTVTESSLYT